MNKPLKTFMAATGSQNPSRNAPRIDSRAMGVMDDYREGAQAA